MRILEQEIVDFFSYENEVFHQIESNHIRELIKKVGITIEDLLDEEKFHIFITKFLENKIKLPIASSDELIELMKIFKINAAKIKKLEQLNSYLSFYMRYFEIIVNGGITNNIVKASEIESSRNMLPIYHIVNDKVQETYNFKQTNKLNVSELSKLLKLEIDKDFTKIKQEINPKYFKPFLSYNENIHLAFDGEKICNKKINFLGSLFELKKFIELLTQNDMIFSTDNTLIKISQIFTNRGKIIQPEQLIKPSGSQERIELLKFIILKSKK